MTKNVKAEATVKPTKKSRKVRCTDEPLTGVFYAQMQGAFDFFNERLFGGELPDVVFTVYRRKNTRGYYWAEKWTNGDREAAEIGLNALDIHTRAVRDVLSTIVHEMCHHAQHIEGTAPKKAYHNKRFSEIMEGVGLICSSTGLPGGKKTGNSMTHHVAGGGLFDAAADELIEAGFAFPWGSTPDAETAPSRKTRMKFTCPTCGCNAWGKPELSITCNVCEEEMEAEGMF